MISTSEEDISIQTTGLLPKNRVDILVVCEIFISDATKHNVKILGYNFMEKIGITDGSMIEGKTLFELIRSVNKRIEYMKKFLNIDRTITVYKNCANL
ncbi:hypothetical protein QYM36_006822 [Artemia franciscana]|uniref:Uncharacterized protein n=1 Tax=Artemia franciscana TaxID=6661 RepID=A0AA88HYJ9_ARTSF|nr:hypothetical protein QYM36_006822 [Artemia franciscana]